MKCCGVIMIEERAKQYLETRYECKACRKLIAIHDNGYTEILRESVGA